MLGYPSNVKGYTLFNLHTKTVFISRNVIFHETVFPYFSKLLNPTADGCFVLPNSIPDFSFPDIAPASIPTPISTSQSSPYIRKSSRLRNPLLTYRIFIVSRLVLLSTLLFLQLEILHPPQVYHILSLPISLIKSFLMLTIVLACLFRLFFSLNSFIKPSNIHIGERLCRLKSPLSRKITLGP